MTVDSTPDVEEAGFLSRFKALIQTGSTETAEGIELLTTLTQHFGEGHPVLQECERLIRLEHFKRKVRNEDTI